VDPLISPSDVVSINKLIEILKHYQSRHTHYDITNKTIT
jgi:hypothetical protein